MGLCDIRVTLYLMATDGTTSFVSSNGNCTFCDILCETESRHCIRLSILNFCNDHLLQNLPEPEDGKN